MSRLLIFLSVAFICLTGFHKKDSKDFTITFIASPGVKISKLYLDVVTDKFTRDSALLVNGKAIFKGKIEVPVKAQLLLLMQSESGNNSHEFIDVLLEPSNIIIDASKGFRDVNYAGSKTQAEFNKWSSSVNPIYKQMISKWGEYEKYNKSGEKENALKMRDEITALSKKVKAVKEDFLLQNNNSLVAALMLKDYVTLVWENVLNAEKIYNNLTPRLKELPEIKKFKQELDIALTMAPGKTYPDFILPDSTGKMVNLSSLKGKYVLIDFWASWCKPCRDESPALVAAYNKYNSKGFEILGVSFDENPKSWLKAVIKDGYTWTNVVDTTGMGTEGITSSKFNINAIPRNFLLDKEGKVIATNLRGEELDKKLSEFIKE